MVARARLLRAGRRGSRRRPLPGLRPLVDDPAAPLDAHRPSRARCRSRPCAVRPDGYVANNDNAGDDAGAGSGGVASSFVRRLAAHLGARRLRRRRSTRVRDAIARGDVYQVNLVQHLAAQFAGDPGALAARLAPLQPPRSSALPSATAGRSSPARPSSSSRGAAAACGRARSRARGRRRAERAGAVGEGRGRARDDRRSRAQRPLPGLRARQRALARADGRRARWPASTHMVSTVEGTLRDGVGLAELLGATFPGGSITGAPKIAAVDLIAELEPVGRGASMGALGRVCGNGDLELALTIRTFAIAEGQIHLWVGGGVVWDSDPAGGDRGVAGSRPIRCCARSAPPVDPTSGRPRAPARSRDERAACSPSPSPGVASSTPASPSSAPTTRAFTRGRAAFETMRVYDGRPFRLAAAPRPARGLGRAHRARAARRRPSSSACRARARAGRRARGGAPALLVAGAAGRRAPRDRARRRRSRPGSSRPARAGQRLVSLLQPAPLGAVAPRRRRSRRATPSRIAAESEAKARGADDAVFVDADDIVLEGPVTNIWWREGDVLLDAVARDRHPRRRDACRAARARAWRGTGRRGGALPARAAARDADEVFTSSSVREVMPVVALDERPLERGPAAAELQEALRREARR